MRYRLLLPACLLLNACGSNPVEKGATLASLDDLETLPGVEQSENTELPTLEEARERAIASYRAYLRDAPDGARRREAMRRVADLTMEVAAEADADGNGSDGQIVPEEVIELYRDLLTARGAGEAADATRYQLARALEYNGRYEDALEILDELIASGPETPYYGEALFRRAESLFSEGDFRSAEQRYAQVVDLGEATDFFDHALYKQAWSRFRQGRYEAAVAPFLRLYDRGTDSGRIDRDALRGAEAQRLDDALRAIALAFSYEGGAASAAGWFERNGAVAFEDRIYDALANQYLEDRAWSDAASTFGAFADRNPLHPSAPSFRVRAIEAWSAGGFPTEVLRAKEDFALEYGIPGPFWDSNATEDHPDVIAALKSHTEELARHYHAAVQAGGDEADLERAIDWYRRFLVGFPTDPQAPELSFRLADLLFDAERFEDAAGVYETTAYEYGDHPRAGEAAYAGLLARERFVETLREDDVRRPVESARATDAALSFAIMFVDHPQAPSALARAAETLYSGDEPERAADAALTFVEAWPESDAALRRSMWQVIGYSRFDLEDYVAAEQAFVEMIRLDPVTGRDDLDERLAASIYRQAEAHRSAGDLLAASEDFLRIGSVAPAAAIRAQAEFDAAAVLLELEAWDQAIPVLAAYRDSYPDDAAVPEINRRLAVAQLRAGDLAGAAREFRALADSEGDDETRREALVQAAELFQSTGDDGQAIEAWTTFVDRYPAPVEAAMEARQQIADLHGALGDDRARRRWLETIIAEQDAAGSDATERTRYLAAAASMELARERLEAFEAVRLVEPIRENLKRKNALMEEVLEAFTRTAEYRVTDFTTAATYHIGAIYQGFSRDLLESERPGDLDGDALGQYEIMLEEQAFPFEEKAIEIYEVNANRVLDSVWDEWIARSYGALAELVPGRYARQEKSRAVLALVD